MRNAQDGHGPGLSGWALKCILVKNEGGGEERQRTTNATSGCASLLG